MNTKIQLNITQVKTMSSLEIAELCLKRHPDVKRDIEVMCNQLMVDVSNFAHIYFDSMNRQQTEYRLDKETTLCLVAGYSAPLRMAIIKRWQELEGATRLPQSFAEALQLAADQAKQLELAAPKVQYFDTVVERSNLLNATQVAQKVGMSAVCMNKLLDELGVYNRCIKRSRVFQQWFIDQGLGELKQTEAGYPQAMFTTKGEAWVIQKFVSEGVTA
ncbi:Rha family transcriptional regulator [Acinetobacter radioresistens]|uniref:Rha family transcriptional regulator n=1 Tax=Acinetobacter radioresistens TaxID=40216 RepID=UPI0006199175|nr:phage antirepressor KilAC domain-containing protein [Acinetobacter radioresistens]